MTITNAAFHHTLTVARLIVDMGNDGLLQSETVSLLIDAFEEAAMTYERRRANLAGYLSELIMEERLTLEGEQT